jgi:hypothetical protein
MNRALLDLTRHTMWQALLHMSGPLTFREPPLKEPDPDWIRKPRVEGRHFKPGLLRARYVGDIRPELWTEPVWREKGEPTGATVAAHTVRGHRRRQHYGPKGSLTKLIWIRPYRTGLDLEQDEISPV